MSKDTIVIAGCEWGQFQRDDGQNIEWARAIVLEANNKDRAKGYVPEIYKLKPELVERIKDMPGMYEVEIIKVKDYKSGMRGFKIVDLEPARAALGMVR